MPRYYFDVIDGVSAEDADGTDLPDIYTAQAEAIRFSGEILTHLRSKFWDGTEWKLNVLNHQRRLLFTLRFSAEGPLVSEEPRSVGGPL